MSNAGRPRKPTELKKIEGTYRKDRDIGQVDAEVLAEVPPPPNSLSATAKREWGIICTWLFAKNLLAHTDLSLLAMYCAEVARYFDLEKQIKRVQKEAFLQPDLPDPPDPPDFNGMDGEEAAEVQKIYMFEHRNWKSECSVIVDRHDAIVRRHMQLISLQAISSQKALALAIQFGFTPVARTRIKMPEKKQTSRLDKLME